MNIIHEDNTDTIPFLTLKVSHPVAKARGSVHAHYVLQIIDLSCEENNNNSNNLNASYATQSSNTSVL